METSRVQVISEEILNPSSQTPHPLKNLKLSLLDQLVPSLYIPLIFFYQPESFNALMNNRTTTHAQISEKLKQSLSDTLTKFYPLAGKFNEENFSVDCNDAGVKYVEARVHARLLDVVRDPSKEQLKQYLPALADNHIIILAVQINFFDCGGVAVGVCLWHHIGDIESLVTFMNSWAAMCRGAEDKVLEPNFNLTSYFPSRDLSGQTNILLSRTAMVHAEEKLVTKRFVFGKEKLEALREAATSTESTNSVKDPTRVELVSAFIWKYFIEIAKPKKLANTKFTATQVVNLRKRTVTAHYLERVFGNCVMIHAATFDHHDEPELKDLIHEFRKAIRAVNDEYIKRSLRQDEHGYVNKLEKFYDQTLKGELELCIFSSWCRFPVYEVDYGWGKPVWVGTTAFSLTNCTLLMDTKDGFGIEAWIDIPRDNVESLESYFKRIQPPSTKSIKRQN